MRMTSTLLFVTLVAGCTMTGGPLPAAVDRHDSTYRRVLTRAERGDAEYQNAVGYMLYFGEGVRMDRASARAWFERAAALGSQRARRNLASIDRKSTGATPPEAARTNAWVPHAPTSAGERSYAKFCGGCHGVNGIAEFEHSPSFAFRERLEKSDAALMRSLLDGVEGMPGWEGKLPIDELHGILAFVRTLPVRYDAGIDAPLRSTPPLMYIFGPMEQRPRAAVR